MHAPKLRALLPLLPMLVGCKQAGEDEGSDDSEALCGLDPDGPEQPWFTVRDAGEELVAGADFAVECGFQGAFMIQFDADLGGFEPAGDTVRFQVTLDVEGFNVGPNGHFAQSTIDLFVGCCDNYEYGCYYQTTNFIIFPPDQIADLAVIHGAAAKLSVNMNIPEGDVLQEFDVQMWAVPDEMWNFCQYGNYAIETLPITSGIPIPTPSS